MMTMIRNRNRLLRLAGVVLLTAALALIPAAAFAADGSQAAGSATARTPLLPPTPVEDFAGSRTADNEVALSWQDSADTINPLCYGPTFYICMWAAFFGYSAADIDAPSRYTVERRLINSRGTAGAWSQIAAVSGANGNPPAAAYTDNPGGGSQGRTFEYRVKACNSQGCSAWSSNASVTVMPSRSASHDGDWHL